jgi:hypothetical protein
VPLDEAKFNPTWISVSLVFLATFIMVLFFNLV